MSVILFSKDLLRYDLGYTALHLVALESLPWSGKEICYNLLLFGVDRNIRCNQGTKGNMTSVISLNLLTTK
jgi:hypothetical protein